MKLLPISESLSENGAFVQNPLCQESVYLTIEFYKKRGFNPPWIGYYAKSSDKLVGAAGFKGKPVNGRIEIAYGTFPQFRNKGIGTKICRQLVELSLKSDPSVTVTARTLPEKNYSNRILERNGFVLVGSVQDEEDGEVWEWELPKKLKSDRGRRLK